MTHSPDLPIPAPARRALDAYRQRLATSGDERPITVAWAPGRINLIGEHTDYNEGYVLPAAIDRVVALAGRPSDDADTRLYSLHHDESVHFAASPGALALKDAAIPTWSRYVRGVLAQFAALPNTQPNATPTTAPDAPGNFTPPPLTSVGAHGRAPAPGSAVPTIPAFSAAIAGDVPLGGGLSSSAALEVATATFLAALGGPSLPPMETALLCQRAENTAVGVQSGIMDQAASCLGRTGHALLLDCRSLDYQYVAANLPDVVLALYDTNVPHTLATSGYNERRRQCEEAFAILAAEIQRDEPERPVRSLRDITADDLADYADALPDVLLRRARHVIGENARVLLAVEALQAGDPDTLGTLLLASHMSLRDDYEVSCPELDIVVEIARTVPGVLGARMMGAGFGGSALILARADAVPVLDAALARDYPIRTGRVGAFEVCCISGGPGHTIVES